MDTPRRRRGRPPIPESERRKHAARTYLNEAERATFEQALEAAGVTEAEILRRLTLEWATKETGREPVLAGAS